MKQTVKRTGGLRTALHFPRASVKESWKRDIEMFWWRPCWTTGTEKVAWSILRQLWLPLSQMFAVWQKVQNMSLFLELWGQSKVQEKSSLGCEQIIQGVPIHLENVKCSARHWYHSKPFAQLRLFSWPHPFDRVDRRCRSHSVWDEKSTSADTLASSLAHFIGDGVVCPLRCQVFLMCFWFIVDSGNIAIHVSGHETANDVLDWQVRHAHLA